MKRSGLLTHRRRYGCYLKREGGAHSLWTNPQTGQMEAVPPDLAVILALAALPDSFRGNPADRLIVATARIRRLPLATRDTAIGKFRLVKLGHA